MPARTSSTTSRSRALKGTTPALDSAGDGTVCRIGEHVGDLLSRSVDGHSSRQTVAVDRDGVGEGELHVVLLEPYRVDEGEAFVGEEVDLRDVSPAQPARVGDDGLEHLLL